MAEIVPFAKAPWGLPALGRPLSPAEEHWRDPIAIVGMHARLPKSATLAQYWDNLAACRDCVGPRPAGRAGDDAGVAEAGFLDHIDAFDAAFFGIFAEEAAMMDPLQRLALESAWHCIEDAGYRAADLRRQGAGVFFATGKSDYEELLYRNDVEPDATFATGVATSVIANRISFALGLTGPSLAIDSACSGSLAALHMAAQAIRNGDCAVALVGAANLILSPTLSQSLKREGALSPECRTRSFDAAGNGYARGEGAVSLLLKKRVQAEADGDHIYGLLTGSAISHGGRANWLTAPNTIGQEQLILTAWRRAGVDPRTIGYIEAHGTGTSIGDPIEFNAIRGAYAKLTGSQSGGAASQRCAIGSVKANIGHIEAASGLAGIVKVLLAMRHRRIPGNPHLRTVNPMCKTQGTPFHFAQDTGIWERLQGADGEPLPYRAGISAFGFGGAYGHVLIEEYSSAQVRGDAEAEAAPVLPILPLSAKDPERLRCYAERLASFVREIASREATQDAGAVDADVLEDFLYTFQIGRTPLPSRVAFVARDWQSLADALASFSAGKRHADSIEAVGEPSAAAATDDEMDALSLRFARQWVDGAKVDFASLYAPGQRRRVAAPGYPFAPTRFWFTDRTAPARLQADAS